MKEEVIGLDVSPSSPLPTVHGCVAAEEVVLGGEDVWLSSVSQCQGKSGLTAVTSSCTNWSKICEFISISSSCNQEICRPDIFLLFGSFCGLA